MTGVYEKRISDRIEGVFPPTTQSGFDVDAPTVQQQAIGILDQRYLLAHAGHAHVPHTYTRVPPLRLLDQLDPRMTPPAARGVMSKTKAGIASLAPHSGTRAGTVGAPTGLLLLCLLVLSQTLSEMPHHAPHSQPDNRKPQHSPSIQISPASSQTNPDQGPGNQSSGNSDTTQAPVPASSAIQTASTTTPVVAQSAAASTPDATAVGGRGGGPSNTPGQPSAPSTAPVNLVNQPLPNITVTVPPVSIPSQSKPIVSTNGTSLTLN